FHAEWLRDEPWEATTTGPGSYIPVVRCQLSPGNGEHEIRVRGYHSRFPVTSFPFPEKGSLLLEATFPRSCPATRRIASSTMAHYELRCRECDKTWGNQPRSICDGCFSPLEVSYDYDAVRAEFTREKISQRAPNMWRYSELLPLPESYKPSLSVGFTPLLSAPHLAQQIGARKLFLKNDAVCLPTLSFKDRVVAVALAQARSFGFDTVSCSSTGN